MNNRATVSRSRYAVLTVAAILLFGGAARSADNMPPEGTAQQSAVEFPAELYWGGYHGMDQLVDQGAQWDFVRRNMDGMLLHFGYWLNNDFHGDPVGVGKKLAEVVNPLGKRFMMEIGWPGRTTAADQFDDMGTRRADKYADDISHFEKETGIHIDSLSAELRLYIFRQVADHYADFDQSDVFAQITGDRNDSGANVKATNGYWADFIRETHRRLPGVSVNLDCPPLYVPWDDQWFAGKVMSFDVVRGATPNGAARTVPMRFNGPDLFAALFKTDTVGFVCDSPYFLLNNPAYIQKGYGRKLMLVQQWLRAHGKQFTFIVNCSPDAKSLGHDSYDLQYKLDSLKSLAAFQAMGGRADRYTFESWYAGPYAVVPETKEGTFTNLVADALRYLKGSGETLNLAARNDGDHYALQITNKGDVACMPVLRSGDAQSATDPGWRYAVDGADITSEVNSPVGYVFTGLIQPGETQTVRVVWTPASPSRDQKPAQLEAYWNPQDPSKTPKAQLLLAIPRP